MKSESPINSSNNPNDLNKVTSVTGNVETPDDSIKGDRNIAGDVIYGNKIAGDQITAEIGAGVQNVIVGSGNTQIIGYTAEQVAIIITQIRREDQPQGWTGRTPYMGLDSFSEQQAHLFFGREKLVAHLLMRIQGTRFLCITGPSGSGKSSLLQAGLIPKLRAGSLSGSDQWLFETVRPGNQPLENLALMMGRLAKSLSAADDFRRFSTTQPLILHAQLETLLSHQVNQRAVIVVDQFEEIFTQTKDETVRLTFLTLLTNAVQHTDGRVSVLISMRSDFLSQCATYADLRQLISGQLELVGAMEPEELARAIAMPALEVGVEVKADLVAQVINDMRGEPGALPLMQFALKDIFDAQHKQTGKPVALTLQEYLTRGGIQQALERHANIQFAKFSPEEQGIARQIFMSLIEVGRGTVDTRRTAAFSELLPLGINVNQVEHVVQILANARLITTDNLPSEQATSAGINTRNVTIAHEKLIEAWPWLQQLVRENRTLIELQNQISEDATQWIEHKQDAGYLYTGARLQTAKEQLETNQLTLSALAQQLIDASNEAETKRLQQIEDARQHEIAQQRQLADVQRNRVRWLAGMGLVALLLAAAASWFGIQSNHNATVAQAASTVALEQKVIAQAASMRADQKAQEAQAVVTAQAIEVINRSHAQATAEAERARAQHNAQIALSRQLAAQSTSELNSNRYESAILLAIESGRATDTLEAFAAIRGAIANPWHIRMILHSVLAATWNRDESKILTNSDDGTARIWDAASGEELVTLTGHTNIVLAATWNRDESKILTRSADGTARIWDAASGEELVRLTGHTQSVLAATWNRDESKILTSSDDGTARIWDAASGEELVRLTGHTQSVDQAMWNRDGSKILTSGADGTARIWDAASGEELVTLTGHTHIVLAATWNRDESKILTNGDDGTARIWDAASGEELVTLTGHTRFVLAATWNRDESKILTSGDDGTARIWDAASGEELVRLTGHTQSVLAATGNRDESKILTSSADGTARIWYVRIQDLIDAACQWVPRNMTETEWDLYMEAPYRPTCPKAPIPINKIKLPLPKKVIVRLP